MKITHLLPKALVVAAVATPGLFAGTGGAVQAAPPATGSQVSFNDFHGGDYYATEDQANAASSSRTTQGSLASLNNNARTVPVADESSHVLGDCSTGNCGTSYAGCNGCGALGACGCYPAKGLIAGVEATFLWADVNGGGQGSIGTYDAANNLAVGFANGGSDLDGEYGFAPRLTLGYQGERWGIVGRYWDFRADGSAFDPFVGGFDAIGYDSVTSLRLYTTDLELRRLYNVRGWSGYGSFGARYAYLNTDSGLRSTTIVGNDLLNASALSGSSVHGTGITGSLVGARPLFTDSNVSLFWSVRGSVLWGDGTADAYTSASAISGSFPAAAASYNGAHADGGSTLYIAELQAGLQWTHQLRCLPGVAFFRIAGEYQYWDTRSGIGAEAYSAADINPGSAVAAYAAAGNTEIDLYGLSVGTGFSW